MASNRDEYLARPTAVADFWEPPNDNVLAGRDLEVHPSDEVTNGTWLGITRQGKFAALTNYREPAYRGNITRGALVRDFLWSDESVHEGLEVTKEHAAEYGGFNLIYFQFNKDKTDMAYFTNRGDDTIADLEPGVVYGLSNSTLTTPWKKVEHGRELFGEILDEGVDDECELIDSLFNMLSTTEPLNHTDDPILLSEELKEHIFCPKFHNGPDDARDYTYATRSSTIVLIDYDNCVTYVERNWHDENHELLSEFNDAVYKFELEE
ncbi:NRDE protein-domain-containing protein [Pilobolus umbonatus]|nr:NRDE protein-domain-containing protein [Pilobolus umbonatus]